MIKTEIIWRSGTPTQDQLTEISNFINKMIRENKTDGDYRGRINDNNLLQNIVERSWVDIDSANQWISFILEFQPVSAKIID